MNRLTLIGLVTATLTIIILMGLAPSALFINTDKPTVNQLVQMIETNDLKIKNQALRK